MDRRRTGTQDRENVESRDETADDGFRNRPTLARRTGIPIDDRDIVVAVAAGWLFEIECSRSRQDATLHEDSPQSCAATENGRAIEIGAILHGTCGRCCDHAGTPLGVL
jgi:hypothetical protein